MSDITKCCGNGCQKRDLCLLYTSPASTYQMCMDSTECIKNDHILFYEMRNGDSRVVWMPSGNL